MAAAFPRAALARALIMFVIQVLLPAGPAERAAASQPQSALALTYAELAARFNGMTAYIRAQAREWTSPRPEAESDDVVMVEVVTPFFDREWWTMYAEGLAQRFDQTSIRVRAMTIETPARRS